MSSPQRKVYVALAHLASFTSRINLEVHSVPERPADAVFVADGRTADVVDHGRSFVVAHFSLDFFEGGDPMDDAVRVVRFLDWLLGLEDQVSAIAFRSMVGQVERSLERRRRARTSPS